MSKKANKAEATSCAALRANGNGCRAKAPASKVLMLCKVLIQNEHLGTTEPTGRSKWLRDFTRQRDRVQGRALAAWLPLVVMGV
jgi:hypothetical protein